MLYVGKGLRAVAALGGVEPALINPELRVGYPPNHSGQGMPYWPAYSSIEPVCRAAYLDWLAGGRKDPGAYIGYVFLFFYGLERRALADIPAGRGDRAEWALMAREVDRLLSLYGANGSFRSYATNFRRALNVLQGTASDFSLPEGPLVAGENSLAVSLAISRCVRESTPLSPQLALAWVLAEAEVPLRTPATRCPRELRELFTLRYGKKFDQGLVVPARKATFRPMYRPASASFGGEVSLSREDWPQPSTQPLRGLRTLLEECVQELDAYSRWLGRNTERASGLAVAALLPPELAVSHPNEDVQRLRRLLEERLGREESTFIEANELLSRFSSATPDKLPRTEAILLLQALEKLGFGVEPDVRFGGPTPAAGGQLLVFRLAAEAPATPSAAYAAASALLHLAALVAMADGSVSEGEQLRIESHLESSLELAQGERVRLRAHLRWLLTTRPGLAGMKRRLASLDTSIKATLGRFIIEVAGADGHVSAEELKMLGRLYPLLNLDESELYSLVHTAEASPTPAPATEPVTVRAGSPRTGGFAIPPPPKASPGVALNMAAVQAKLAETAAVSSLLSSIFTEESSPPPPPPPPPDVERVAGLDAAHSALLRALAERPSWPRADLEQLAARLGLLPDGALDALNDAALDTCGEVVWDGEDPINMNMQTLQEMLA